MDLWDKDFGDHAFCLFEEDLTVLVLLITFGEEKRWV